MKEGRERLLLAAAIPLKMPPNQFNFPFPCRYRRLELAVAAWSVGWFVDLGAFTVGCVIRYGEGEKRKRISPPGQEDSSYCGSQ